MFEKEWESQVGGRRVVEFGKIVHRTKCDVNDSTTQVTSLLSRIIATYSSVRSGLTPDLLWKSHSPPLSH